MYKTRPARNLVVSITSSTCFVMDHILTAVYMSGYVFSVYVLVNVCQTVSASVHPS